MKQSLNEKFGLSRISNMLHHITSLNYLPRWLVLFIDIFISITACVSVFYLARIVFPEGTSGTALLSVWSVATVVFIQIFFFWVFQTYAGILRLSTYVDALKLLLAVISTVVTLFAINFANFLLHGSFLIPSAFLLVYAVKVFLFLFLVRLGAKVFYDYFVKTSGRITPVMIYGTKQAAIGIAEMLRVDPSQKYKLVGFIDDDKNNTQWSIMGVKVYLLNEENVKNIISKKTKTVIVSPLKMEKTGIREDLNLLLEQRFSILTTQPMSTWEGAKPSSSKQLKSIQIEDLLERPQIEISTENIANQLKSKIVLVTGAAGSIGSEIVRQILKHKPALIVLLDQAETPMHDLRLELEKNYPKQRISIFLGDVRNKARMEHMMNSYKPDVIYHAAAYKHVPLMEDNPVESVQANVFGTKNLANLAVKHKVERFVMVSTDKAVNPTNVMGASKRIAEIYVQSLAKKLMTGNKSSTKFITTRFGNVLGSNGSVIPYFKKQIEAGGPVTVTHPEVTRYFMTIPEACMLVLEAGAMGNGDEIFIFDMGESVKIVDLAKKMIRLAGRKLGEDIEIAYTGLRPGEKLYEELFCKKELTTETCHPKIMIAKVQEYDYDEVSVLIDELIFYGSQCKDFLVVQQMKKIVPEFQSNNSPYEILDIEKK